ncbi:MAG: glutathione peroxidase [Phycisphaerae bacterium]
MHHVIVRGFAIVISAAIVAAAFAQEAAKPPDKKPDAAGQQRESKPVTAAGPLEFTVKDIDGKDVPLSRYKGKVVLIVNVASKCGFTPQYEQLQALHAKYSERGLAILAFPANDFGQQEPAPNAEIKQFCDQKYGVKFDLFAKISVKGEQSADLYKFLTSREKNGEFGGEIKWNFTKFLVDRAGKVIARYESRIKPDADEVVKAIEKALDAKKPS